MKLNDNITCKVVGFQEYGMFVNCGDYDGLVHISEISDQYISNIEQIFNLGDEVKLLVLGINADNKRLKLSYKAAHEINKRIVKNINIKIAFHSLNNALPKWINDKKKETDDL